MNVLPHMPRRIALTARELRRVRPMMSGLLLFIVDVSFQLHLQTSLLFH